MRYTRIVIVGLIALADGTFAQPSPLVPLLPANVQTHTEKALNALGMTLADAGFEKDHGKPLWALSWITNTLADPWMLPLYAEKLYEAAASPDPVAWWNISSELTEIDSPPVMAVPEWPDLKEGDLTDRKSVV